MSSCSDSSSVGCHPIAPQGASSRLRRRYLFTTSLMTAIALIVEVGEEPTPRDSQAHVVQISTEIVNLVDGKKLQLRLLRNSEEISKAIVNLEGNEKSQSRVLSKSGSPRHQDGGLAPMPNGNTGRRDLCK